MLKYLLIFFGVFGNTLLDYVFNDVTVYAKFPSEVVAGEDFEMQITVEKGNLAQFGRFTQQLPDGFAAYSEDNEFSFENQKVTYIWVNLPPEKSFTFTYKVSVPSSYSGNAQIGGQFAYILDNERKFAEIIPKEISVKSSSTDPSKINNTPKYASSGENDIPQITDINSMRSMELVGNELYVTIETQKGNLTQMAKITENIPSGYTAEAVESNNGIFTFNDNKIKYLWMNLPSETHFAVTYKLKANGGKVDENIKISGVFSYSANNLTQSIEILDKPVQLAISDNIKISPDIANDQSIGQTASVDNTSYTSTIKNDDRVGNVTYRIQIAAGHKLVNVNRYFKKYKITDKVVVDLHDGWHKYTTGSYYEYKTARNARTHIWNTTPIDDAFVTAYNNGVRITVQEALMIANQKWYK